MTKTAASLLLLLLAASARAGVSSPIACAGADDLHLAESVEKARELAQSCLVAGGLNPELGRRILSPAAKLSPTYHCAYKIDAQAVTTWDKPQPDVAVDMDKARPDSQTSVPELRPIDSTVFHELLHVADSDGGQLFSLFSHNNALGFPDGIYGCEYACGGAIETDAPAYAYVSLFEAAVRPLPEDARYACPKDSPDDCSTLKKFAALCRGGALKLSGEEKLGLRFYENAICLQRNASSIDPKSPFALAQSVLKADADARAAGGNADQRRARELIGDLKLLIDARKNGGLLDLAWLSGFFKAQGCPPLGGD